MATILLVIIYVCFINLGLPDSIIGSSWPAIFVQFNIAEDTLSYVSLIGTVVTIGMSFFAGKLIKKIGTPIITLISVTLTASGLLLMFFSDNIFLFAAGCLPLGAGAGAIDVSLNAYVARYYKSREMNWLHCFWGLGASASTVIVSAFVDANWHTAFLIVSLLQFGTAILLLFTLPLWKKVTDQKEKMLAQLESGNTTADKPETICEDTNIVDTENADTDNANTLKLDTNKRKKPLLFTSKVILGCLSFFCYCALENITGTWGNTFLVLYKGFTASQGALLVSLFYIGITVGRFINGFISMKVPDQKLIFAGIGIIVIGIAILIITSISALMFVGFGLIGLGCAPIYPSSMQLTTVRYGRDNTPEVLGYQSAFGGLGITCMTPLFGIVATATSFVIFPFVLIAFAALQVLIQLFIIKKTAKS